MSLHKCTYADVHTYGHGHILYKHIHAQKHMHMHTDIHTDIHTQRIHINMHNTTHTCGRVAIIASLLSVAPLWIRELPTNNSDTNTTILMQHNSSPTPNTHAKTCSRQDAFFISSSWSSSHRCHRNQKMEANVGIAIARKTKKPVDTKTLSTTFNYSLVIIIY